jgi:hypothetical protein
MMMKIDVFDEFEFWLIKVGGKTLVIARAYNLQISFSPTPFLIPISGEHDSIANVNPNWMPPPKNSHTRLLFFLFTLCLIWGMIDRASLDFFFLLSVHLKWYKLFISFWMV